MITYTIWFLLCDDENIDKGEKPIFMSIKTEQKELVQAMSGKVSFMICHKPAINIPKVSVLIC